MITWTRRSGHIHYQSQDHTYTVQEGYRWGKWGFCAILSGCLSARALGPLRDTAEEARDDCDRFERGEISAEQVKEMLRAEREACGVAA